MATDVPIEVGNVYKDICTDLFVKVSSISIDEDGNPQVRVGQYTDSSCNAHSSAGYTDEYDSARTLAANDLRDRILSGELHLQ